MGSVYRRKGAKTYTAEWTDADGARRRKSTGTRDKEISLEILAHLERQEARVRAGVISSAEASRSAADRVPIGRHLSEYIAWCRNTNQAKRAVDQKERHLRALIAEEQLSRFSELTADRVAHNLAGFGSGRSARTVNFRRQHVAAFVAWAKKTGRTDIDPMPAVPRQDEERCRRRIRRALTDAEAAQLLSVARERGRWLWYALALLAGLRKGDLRRLRWSDIDLEQRTLEIRQGKAKRVDVLPLHPDLVDELSRIRPLSVLPTTARVFGQVVTDATRLRDFACAGLARRVVVTDDEGEPVMLGTGKRRRPKTKLVAEDESGRVVDLHALRATLGTMLARQGVTPQVAQRIMRHGDYRTTLKHYTALTLTDSSAAIERISLPDLAAAVATGTDGASAAEGPVSGIGGGVGAGVGSPGQVVSERRTGKASPAASSRQGASPSGRQTSAPVGSGSQSGAGSTGRKRATRLERATFSLEG